MSMQVAAGPTIPLPAQVTKKDRPQRERKPHYCCLCEKIRVLIIRIINFFKERFQAIGKKRRAMVPKNKSRLEKPATEPRDPRAAYYLHIPADGEKRTLEFKQFLYREEGLTPPDKIPDDDKRDRVEKRVATNGLELEHLSLEAQDDDKIVQIAVNQNWRARQFASARLQKADMDHLFNPKAQAIAKVQRSGVLLGTKELAPFIDDEEVVTEAVKRSSRALDSASERLQKNPVMKQLAQQTAITELK